MGIKETKRKGFNFFRSYFDVYNMLPTPEDKVAFIDALLEKQFLGLEPKGLKGQAEFAWVSQVNSIDNQVKGWEDKTGLKLNPCQGGVIRGENNPTEQVEGKGKGKEEEEEEVKDNIYRDFLEKKHGINFDQMKMKLRGINEEKFLDFFENKCIMEDIPFNFKKLNARFNLLLSNWNKEKSSAKKETTTNR